MTESTKDYVIRLGATVIALITLSAAAAVIYGFLHGDLVLSESFSNQLGIVVIGILVAVGQFIQSWLTSRQGNEREQRIIQQVVQQIKLGYRNGDGQVIAEKVKEVLRGQPGGRREDDPPAPDSSAAQEPPA